MIEDDCDCEDDEPSDSACEFCGKEFGVYSLSSCNHCSSMFCSACSSIDDSERSLCPSCRGDAT